jgi:maleylacetoacetate isomerase
MVPALVDGPQVLTQSLAILEYLEETRPQPSFLPKDAPGRARVRALAQIVASDIHPLNNLRVLRYLVNEMKLSEADKDRWYKHWVEQGLASVEKILASDSRVERYCFGDTPGYADCFLVPQVANAQRMQCDLSGMPTIRRINDACLELESFAAASPARQPDAE